MVKVYLGYRIIQQQSKEDRQNVRKQIDIEIAYDSSPYTSHTLEDDHSTYGIYQLKRFRKF